jgi:hypothetical protein
MATRSRTIQQSLFHGPAWPRDNTSDFESDSPPGSSLFSSGYESIISEDLDLYDAGCVCYSPIKSDGSNASASSLEVALTNNQIDALNGCLDEFKAGDYEIREKFVRDFLGSFKRACTQGVVFDETTVRTVRAPSALLSHSYAFLAYSAAPLWQN